MSTITTKDGMPLKVGLGANMKTKLSDDLTLDDVDEAMMNMIASIWNLLHIIPLEPWNTFNKSFQTETNQVR